jgi:two-component system KDP operon response regulator KdpE
MKKLLVIDDDLTLIRLLRQSLEKAGYEVRGAAGGIEGLREMYSFQPDLVILDVMMPGLDGWETCTRIREVSDVPIIMLTAKDAEADKVRGFQLGVDDYVTKPFSLAEFTARVNAVLNRARKTAGAKKPRIYSSGGLVIDVDGCRVTLDAKPVDLTPTEFRLLCALADAGGKVVSNETLLGKVWGTAYSGEIGYIKRYIWYLRHKVEKDPQNPEYVLTERGFGYRLNLD